MVGKDDVTGGIKLYQDMEGVLLLAEGEVHNTINAELGDILQLLRSQVLSQLHGEARRQVLLVLDEVRRVEPDARLQQQVLLPVRSRQLEQVQSSRHIVDVRHSITDNRLGLSTR